MTTMILRCAALLALSTAAHAAITLNGTFAQDDDMFTTSFTLVSPSAIVVQTLSFANGGFAPVVSLFDSLGNLVLFDDGGIAPGGCGARAIDPATGFCLDAYINGVFGADTYTVILTEWDNTPNGPTLADGFTEQGNGNFTGGPFLLNAGPGFQRTSNWTLELPGTAAVAPEPSLEFLSGTLLLLAARWSQRAH